MCGDATGIVHGVAFFRLVRARFRIHFIPGRLLKKSFLQEAGALAPKESLSDVFRQLLEVTRVLLLRAWPEILRKSVKLCHELGDHSLRQ